MIQTVTAVLAKMLKAISRKSSVFTFLNTTKQVSGQTTYLTGEISRSGLKGDRVLLQQQVNSSLHIFDDMMWLHQFWLQNLISVATGHGLCDWNALIVVQGWVWFIDTCTHLRTDKTHTFKQN